jgi:hypothetical protein
MARAGPRRFPWGWYGLALTLILLLAAAPLIGVMVAGAVAEANGCVLHEGFVNSCLVEGVERGDMLYTLFVLGWLMLATIPLGALALCVWLLALIVHRVLWGRRNPVSGDQSPPAPGP